MQKSCGISSPGQPEVVFSSPKTLTDKASSAKVQEDVAFEKGNLFISIRIKKRINDSMHAE